jgi:hypothetical protein
MPATGFDDAASGLPEASGKSVGPDPWSFWPVLCELDSPPATVTGPDRPFVPRFASGPLFPFAAIMGAKEDARKSTEIASAARTWPNRQLMTLPPFLLALQPKPDP